MSWIKVFILTCIIITGKSFSNEKDLKKEYLVGEKSVVANEDTVINSDKFDFTAAWCATANRSCAVLLNLLRVAKQNDNIDVNEVTNSPIVIQQDLYRLMFISWTLEKKLVLSTEECNPPHKWISKKVFNNKLDLKFIENPLGNEFEANLNLGKGNFENLFGTRDNYAQMAIQFSKEIWK